MPEDLNSIKGKIILEKEFGISGTAYGLIQNQNLKEIENIVGKMEEIVGVKEVIWLGTAEDIFKPEDLWMKILKKEFLSKDSNLVQIYFTGPNDSLETVEAVAEIQNLLGGCGSNRGDQLLSLTICNISQKEK